MVTLTVRHTRTDELKPLKEGLASALAKAQQGAPYKRLQQAGLLGVFRTMEVRYSYRTGWHPHLHCLVAIDKADEGQAREIARGLVERYMARLTAGGLSAELAGQDVRRCYDPEGAGDYAGKGALELAHSYAKQGKTSVHPFELARRAGDENDMRAAHLFREYAAVMPGTPQGRISDRLVRELATRLERDPDELAVWLRHGEGEDEVGSEETVQANDQPAVARVPAAAWNDLHSRGATADLVRRVEEGATFIQLQAEGWPVQPPIPIDEASAFPPPEPGEGVHAAAHRLAPLNAPDGTQARGDWVLAYLKAHGTGDATDL
jgi:hypothetical protein